MVLLTNRQFHFSTGSKNYDEWKTIKVQYILVEVNMSKKEHDAEKEAKVHLLGGRRRRRHEKVAAAVMLVMLWLLCLRIHHTSN